MYEVRIYLFECYFNINRCDLVCDGFNLFLLDVPLVAQPARVRFVSRVNRNGNLTKKENVCLWVATNAVQVNLQ